MRVLPHCYYQYNDGGPRKLIIIEGARLGTADLKFLTGLDNGMSYAHDGYLSVSTTMSRLKKKTSLLKSYRDT